MPKRKRKSQPRGGITSRRGVRELQPSSVLLPTPTTRGRAPSLGGGGTRKGAPRHVTTVQARERMAAYRQHRTP